MTDQSHQLWLSAGPATAAPRVLEFKLNGRSMAFQGDPSMPVLWYLRDHAGLTGTKFGCGVGICGACTIHMDGEPVRSCVVRMGDVASRRMTTIEGLAPEGALHPVQQAWIDEAVSQCGYCQAGQIMLAAGLLKRQPSPSPHDIDGITNLCRCGTYEQVRLAIQRAAVRMRAAPW